jgi:2-methylcitrate dehydratase PrpD
MQSKGSYLMKPTNNAMLATAATLALSITTSAFAASHAAKMGVMAEDQAIDGSVTASKVMAANDGW